jgi:hypothetical protein
MCIELKGTLSPSKKDPRMGVISKYSFFCIMMNKYSLFINIDSASGGSFPGGNSVPGDMDAIRITFQGK